MPYGIFEFSNSHGQPKRNIERGPTDYNFPLTAQRFFTIGYIKGSWSAYKHQELSVKKIMPDFEAIDQEMWRGMDSDTDEETLRQCLLASEPALAATWDDPEEDEAWADL